MGCHTAMRCHILMGDQMMTESHIAMGCHIWMGCPIAKNQPMSHRVESNSVNKTERRKCESKQCSPPLLL